FKWVFESKGGYEKEIDLNSILGGKGISKLDEFIEQSTKDSEYCGRLPIICWKRARKPWLTMIRKVDFGKYDYSKHSYYIVYRDWVMLPLEELLKSTKRNFWFNK